MPFSIGEEFLPAILTAHPMTDEEFAELCSEHPDLFFEMSAEGELIVMPPNYSLTGARHIEISGQLRDWARPDGRGIVTDAAAGFVLPNGARRSPDAAWTLKSRLHELDRHALERYWHLCPNFVIEVRSVNDRLRTLRKKMREWIANGAQLAWMLDPENRTAEIYRPDADVAYLENPETLRGEGPVDGFVLQLAPVWNPLGL
jgi:Uma2 family endonuclease